MLSFRFVNLPGNSSARGAGGRRRRLGDGVPLPEREVPSLHLHFSRASPHAARKGHLNSCSPCFKDANTGDYP